MRIDAILLEFDGIVAETYGARRRAFDHAWATHDVVVSRDEYWELCAGITPWEAVRAVARTRNLPLDPTDLDLVVARAEREFARTMASGLTLVDGIRDTLEHLASEARLAVVSSLRRSELDTAIALGQMDELFAFVIGEGDAPRPKPAPDPYHLARRRLDSHGISRVVALEHGAPGIAAARAAGLDVVAVGAQPAHVVVEATAWLPSLRGCTVTSLSRMLTPHTPGT